MTSSEQQKQQSDDDITSQKGMQDASSGSSSLSKYLKQMGDLQREAFEKVYDAVDQPCMHEPCLPTCETDMDQFLMPCHQPITLFHFFEADHRDQDDTLVVAPGSYVIPIFCEYCGSSTTRLCPLSCQRPKLFFRKQRPPFIPSSTQSWDPVTEYELPKG